MPRYQSFDPNTELAGRSALGLIQNMNYENLRPLLKKHHLDEIEADQWYLVKDVLNLFSDIAEDSNSSANFVSIGMAAAQANIDATPPGTPKMNIPDFLKAYEKIYETRHRGGYAGSVKADTTNESHMVVTLNVPYPDDIYYGIVYAYVRDLCPPGKQFTVAYDDNVLRHDDGGEHTIIHVRVA